MMESLLVLQERVFMSVTFISFFLTAYLFIKARDEIGYVFSYFLFACGVLGYTEIGSMLSYAIADTYGIARLVGWVGGPLCIVGIIKESVSERHTMLPTKQIIKCIKLMIICVGVIYFFVFLDAPDYITPVLSGRITEGIHGAVFDTLQSIILIALLLISVRVIKWMLLNNNDADQFRHRISLVVLFLATIYFMLQIISSWLYVLDFERATLVFFVLKIGTQILTGLLIPAVFVSRKSLYRIVIPLRYFLHIWNCQMIWKQGKHIGIVMPTLSQIILRPAYYHHVMNVAILDFERGQNNIRVTI